MVEGVKRPNYVHLTVTCTTGAEDRHLETDVPSMKSSLVPVDVWKYFEEPLLRFLQFSCDITALVTQLQLWHFHWLMPVRPFSDLHLQVPCVV